MNNKEFVAELARRMGFSAKETAVILKSFTNEVGRQLEEENVLAIQGFGAFDVKKKLERVVVNPATKQRMLVPPKMTVNFKASNTLKDKVQK